MANFYQCTCLQVHHLESTGSALAEDVIQKSEIIKTYFMDTKAGKLYLRVLLMNEQGLHLMLLMECARTKHVEKRATH